MRQAIITKYIGPTNSRGARVKATADAGTVTLSWDHALNPSDNHRAAACTLACKLGWLGPNDPVGQTFDKRYAGGGMPQSSPYAYCFVDKGGK